MDFFFRPTRPFSPPVQPSCTPVPIKSQHNPRNPAPTAARAPDSADRPPRRRRAAAAAMRRTIPEQRHRPDDQRPRAAEAGADDDEVALEVHRRRRRRRPRTSTITRNVRIADRSPRTPGCDDHGAKPGADERDADEVRRRYSNAGADQPADDAHASRSSARRVARRRTASWPCSAPRMNPEIDSTIREQPIAEEAGDDARRANQERSAARQSDRSQRTAAITRSQIASPSIARVIVTSSAYSRSEPTGMPIAMRVTRTPSGLSSRAR